MEAPDKIYMPNELLSEEWQRHIEGEDTEYVRKDFLLEWANLEKDKTSIGLSEYDAGHENGRMELLNDLIDKINTL